MIRHRFARLAAAAALIASACGPSKRAELSQPAPDFHLADLAGRTVSLSEYRGKVVMLHFWASWCDSCKAETPVLNDFYKRQNGRVTLLAPSVDEGGRRPVEAFVARYEPAFPILLADAAVQSAYAVRDLPTTFLIAPDGRIARRYVGPIDPAAVENDILEITKAPKTP